MEAENMKINGVDRQNRKQRLSPELAEVLKMLKSLEGQSSASRSSAKEA